MYMYLKKIPYFIEAHNECILPVERQGSIIMTLFFWMSLSEAVLIETLDSTSWVFVCMFACELKAFKNTYRWTEQRTFAFGPALFNTLTLMIYQNTDTSKENVLFLMLTKFQESALNFGEFCTFTLLTCSVRAVSLEKTVYVRRPLVGMETAVSRGKWESCRDGPKTENEPAVEITESTSEIILMNWI